MAVVNLGRQVFACCRLLRWRHEQHHNSFDDIENASFDTIRNLWGILLHCIRKTHMLLVLRVDCIYISTLYQYSAASARYKLR
jgi:hypothetical protein